MSERPLKVIIMHGDHKAEFEGNYKDVWAGINRYLSQLYPTLEVVRKLTGSIDVQEVAERISGLIEIRDGRIILLRETDAKRRILLCLAGAYVGKAFGLIEKDKLTPKEIASHLGMDERVVRARLSELRKAGLVVKYEEGLYGFTPTSLRELPGGE